MSTLRIELAGERLAGLLLLALMLGGLPGCSDSSGDSAQTGAQSAGHATEAQPEEEAKDAIAVRVKAVSRQPLSSLYTTSATLRADKQATITARTPGVVRRLLVEEGDWVKPGQTLAILEDDEQKIEYDRAITTRDNLVREHDRAHELHEQGLMSEEEYETARRNAEEAKQTAALNELVLSRTKIRAPFGGRISRRHLDVGATVNDGTAVYDLADVNPLYADVNVPERQIARLSVGQGVRLVGDSSGDTSRATIERVAPVVDPETGTVKVTLAVNGATGLRPGSFVRVEIVTDTHDQALVIPRSALVAEGRRWHIFRVGPEGGKVERIEVTRGFEEGDAVEVLEAPDSDPPLEPGDTVVVVGARALTDGAMVQIIEPDEAEAEGAEQRTEGEDSRVAA